MRLTHNAWNAHVEYVITNWRWLRDCTLLGCWSAQSWVMQEDMLKVYTHNIRSVLEYAVQVWQNIIAYLSDAIESIQRRALRITFPNSNNLPTSSTPSKFDNVSRSQDIHMQEVDGRYYEDWEAPHIFLSSASYDKIYPISVKIRKY